jgi:peptide/nickel transport system permease protein
MSGLPSPFRSDTTAVELNRLAPLSFIRRAWSDFQVRLGLVITLFVVLFALVGPWFAPRDPISFAGPVFGPPRVDAPVGFDFLGRDVLSRVLAGGRSVVWMSLAVASLALVAGTWIGMVAGYGNRTLDQAIVWATDVFHSFPNLILVLLVVSMLGREPWLIVITAAAAMTPGVVRLTRGLTLGLGSHEFVEAAEVVGLSRFRIRVFEILPNLARSLVVHFGAMLSWAVGILAALSFLGYGVAPPAADWGLMINENRVGLQIQPWAVITPMVLIALLALGTNVLAEGLGRLASGDEKETGA